MLIASRSSAYEAEPRWIRPFTKKRGVLGTPLREPLSRSSATRAECTPSRSSASKRAAVLDPHGLGVRPQLLVAQLELVLEEAVVHLPEAPLRSRGLRGLGRGRRPRVQVLERHMPEHEAELVAEALAQLVHHRIGLAAVGALEVPVLDERDGGIRASAHVVARRIDGRGERGDLRSHGSSLGGGCKMPPAKQEDAVRGRSVSCPCRSLPSPPSGKTGERGNQWPRHLGWGERRVITAKRNTSASPTANPAGDRRDVLPRP